MKNYEKYADEIKRYNGDGFCNNFIKTKIIKADDCPGTDCNKCTLLQFLWLMEEYKEPETDWSKVAVDTPILVKRHENEPWHKRYFANYENGVVHAWCSGRTSWNSRGNTFGWGFAKLAEEGDE